MASLSRTAAKRQAHRESHLYRPAPSTLWDVVAPPGEIGPGRGGLTFAAARRELAAWRAARVRELMGAGTGCSNCGRPIPDHCKVHLIPCCPGKCAGRSKIPAPPAAQEARGDSRLPGEKGGTR